jgi:hypothetical protein
MRPFRSVFGIIVIPLATAALTAVPARAQSNLEDALKQYSGNTVKGYIQPLADLFGANMNAGWFSPGAVPKSGLHFRLSIIGMAAQVSDKQKSYTAPTPTGFSPTSFQTATIFGGTGTLVKNANDTSLQYRGSDGLINATLFPLAVPQVAIGGFAGTEAVVRFITTPSISSGKFPKTTLLGIGARHNISQYLGVVPLDLSVGVFYSSFKVGDIVDFHGLLISGQASKSFSLLTLYGGAAWEQSKMKLSYTSTDPQAPGSVSVTMDGANSFRFTAGAALKLAILRLFADANFGSVTNFSGGIGFGF